MDQSHCLKLSHSPGGQNRKDDSLTKQPKENGSPIRGKVMLLISVDKKL